MFKIMTVVAIMGLGVRQWYLRRQVNTWTAIQGAPR